MFAMPTFGHGDCKGIFDILLAFGIREERLFVGVDDTEQVSGINRNMQNFRQSAADIFALVVSALTQTLRVKGNWNKQIDIIKETRVQPFHSGLTAKEGSQERLFGIFGTMNKRGNLIAILQPGSGSYKAIAQLHRVKRLKLLKVLLDFVTAHQGMFGAWQLLQARVTYSA